MGGCWLKSQSVVYDFCGRTVKRMSGTGKRDRTASTSSTDSTRQETDSNFKRQRRYTSSSHRTSLISTLSSSSPTVGSSSRSSSSSSNSNRNHSLNESRFSNPKEIHADRVRKAIEMRL